MAKIILKTLINASTEKCFNLARNIDLHVHSMKFSEEKAIDGKRSGFIDLNETVTWCAKHFGISFKMTVKITELQKYKYFVDEMIDGPFSKLHHRHFFRSVGTQAEITDTFEFKASFGWLGVMAESMFLKKYMAKLLSDRNTTIKNAAEQSQVYSFTSS